MNLIHFGRILKNALQTHSDYEGRYVDDRFRSYCLRHYGKWWSTIFVTNRACLDAYLRLRNEIVFKHAWHIIDENLTPEEAKAYLAKQRLLGHPIEYSLVAADMTESNGIGS